MIDELFIERVYKSSLWWSALVLSYLMMAKLVQAAVGFAIGVGVALAVLRSIEAVVRTVFVPDKVKRAKVAMPAFGFIKYLILGTIVALIVRSGWVSIPAFACGIGIPSTLIFLKTLACFFSELEFHPFWGRSF